MKISLSTGRITEFPADAIVVNLFEGVTAPGGATGAVDHALGGLITRLITAGEIKGRLNQTTVIHTQGRLAAERVIVVGLGKAADFTLDRVRQAAASAAKAARAVGCRRIGTIVHGAGIGGMDPGQAAQAVVEGTILGLYRFTKYQTSREDTHEVDETTIVEMDPGKIPALQAGIRRGTILADATNLARDLINEPANVMTPSAVAEGAAAIAQAHGLECTILERADLEAKGMRAMLAVAQGSAQPPKLVVLRYWGAGRDDPRPPLALIGKGVTFDTGGISLKPSEKMEEMKGDMAGGAAIIGAMQAIAQLAPPINVIGIVPAVENMPSGTATRPGDIITAMGGKTIEVINTDAEGRMILADAVSYARSLGASPIIDVATLTGAIQVALGFEYTGAFTNHQPTLDRLMAAAKETGEKIWPMPTDDEYKELLKSDVADLKNSGGRYAGAITGALFVGAFAEDTPWVHLDIAGSSKLSDSRERPYQPKFGSGAMVRTLAVFAEKSIP